MLFSCHTYRCNLKVIRSASALFTTGMSVREWRRASSLRLGKTWLPWRRIMRRWALTLGTVRREMGTSTELRDYLDLSYFCFEL